MTLNVADHFGAPRDGAPHRTVQVRLRCSLACAPDLDSRSGSSLVQPVSLRALNHTPRTLGTVALPVATSFPNLLYGFRISPAFGLLVALVGYSVGRLDILTQRGIEIWSALPFLYTIMNDRGQPHASFILDARRHFGRAAGVAAHYVV